MKTKTKILLVTSKAPPEYSGSGNRVVKQYQRIKKNSLFDFSVVSSSTERLFCLPNFKNKFNEKISIKLPFFLSMPDTWLMHRLLTYIEFLIEFSVSYFFLYLKYRQYEFFHIVGDVSLTSAALAFCERNRIPFIYEIVNEDGKKINPLWVRVPFWSRKIKFDNNLSSVKTINARLKSRIQNSHANVNTISFPNSVDLAKIKILEEKKPPARCSDKIKVIYLAKFIPRKRQDVLIEAFKYLPNNYVLDLYGPVSITGMNKQRDAEYLNKLKILTKKIGLDRRIGIHPQFVTNPYDLISKYDVFVYPSFGEAFGTPIIEALLLSVPVVATAGEPAFDEWIDDGKNGFLFDGSPRDLSMKIRACKYLDPQIQKNLRLSLGTKVSHEAADDFLIKEIQKLVRKHDY